MAPHIPRKEPPTYHSPLRIPLLVASPLALLLLLLPLLTPAAAASCRAIAYLSGEECSSGSTTCHNEALATVEKDGTGVSGCVEVPDGGCGLAAESVNGMRCNVWFFADASCGNGTQDLADTVGSMFCEAGEGLLINFGSFSVACEV